MHLINAVALVSVAIRRGGLQNGGVLGAEIEFGTVLWSVYAGISCVLVLFAGIMSGLTLGLMSLGLVDLEILQRSGTPSKKKQAAAKLPVVQKQHQLLVTLLLCNAAAMELIGKMYHVIYERNTEKGAKVVQSCVLLALFLCRLFLYTWISFSINMLPLYYP